MRTINFQYTIKWETVDVFDYRLFENDLIQYDAYLNMESKVKHLSTIINKDKDSRRAICFADGVENPACMSSIQFLINDKMLYMIASFRSQHEKLGRPSDEIMLKFLATKFINELKHDVNEIYIICNVADYHGYEE